MLTVKELKIEKKNYNIIQTDNHLRKLNELILYLIC